MRSYKLTLEGGSPVHAGIDLALGAGSGNFLRFPRTRGDRPVITGEVQSNMTVPPYTRG